MDLGTMLKNIKKYKSPDAFFDDLNLIWSNCKIYNIEESKIYRQAEKFEKLT